MDKRIFFGKIMLVMALGFVITSVLNKEVFIADSPTIRPQLDKYIASRVMNVFNFQLSQISLFASKEQQQLNKSKAALQNMPLSLVSKGVYAKSVNTANYTVVNINDVEWIEYTYVVNGKTIKIKVPAGQQPPPKEAVESAE
ncbi:MAG: hypothetical protein V1922_02905 [bacterium]